MQDYLTYDEIDFTILTSNWHHLVLFDDVFLNMQGQNIGVSDPVITQFEYSLLDEYIKTEKTPFILAMQVSAFSQMWLYATYELLRLWRERTFSLEKWFKNGGIDLKIKSYDENKDDSDFEHVAKHIRKKQLIEYRDNESMREKLGNQWIELQPIFQKIELFRINLAKHSVPGKANVIPQAPGYGRINSDCGAMDYELFDKDNMSDFLNRRDIADELREVLTVISSK